MQYLRLIFVLSLRLLSKFFHIFPINEKRIVFISFFGKQYSCNPKYLFEYIQNYYQDRFEFIWCLNERKLFQGIYKNVKIVRILSLKYAWYALTSKYIINNNIPESFFSFRKKQIVINTWHGNTYKKFGSPSPAYKSRRQYFLTLQKIRSKQTTYIVAPCRRYITCMSLATDVAEEKFLQIGMPRNDIFFYNYSFKEKILDYYSIDQKLKIILYAPTFRGSAYNLKDFHFSLEIEELLISLKEKFGHDFILLYRGHHNYGLCQDKISSNIISANNYHDMQELLSAADVLITDYSSSMWDFSLTFKPCFIYAPDLEAYRNEQGFFIPIEEWPFPIAQTNEDLFRNILQFDSEKYHKNVKKHHNDLGTYETGNARKQFCEVLFT